MKAKRKEGRRGAIGKESKGGKPWGEETSPLFSLADESCALA